MSVVGLLGGQNKHICASALTWRDATYGGRSAIGSRVGMKSGKGKEVSEMSYSTSRLRVAS